MKRFIPIAIAFLPAICGAQRGTSHPGTPAEVQQTILKLEERIWQANYDCDYKFFAEVEGREFIFTDATGGVTTRAEDLAGEKSCKPGKGTFVVDEVRFSLHGDVAVFNARVARTTSNSSGQPVTRKDRYTDVLIWRDGRWQLVAGQSSRIP